VFYDLEEGFVCNIGTPWYTVWKHKLSKSERADFIFCQFYKTLVMKRFYFRIEKGAINIVCIAFYFLLSFAAINIQKATAQTHFTTVWQGENGQNHMNFVVVSASLENLSLMANDEIAVFSGSLCVGAKKLIQPINISVNSTFLNITASQNDGPNTGFTNNDTIIFKIWDNKSQKEMIASAVTYRNDIPTWTTSGKFTPEATAVVEITSYTEYFSTVSAPNADHMNINLLGIQDSGLAAGDELAAFDGEICVGTLRISEDLLSIGSASLIASSSSSDSSPDGFKVGNTIQIKAWNHLTGDELDVEGEIVDGQMKYEKNASVLLEMKSLSTATKSIDNFVKIDVFPNPCVSSVTVRLSQLPDATGRIDILDLSGRKVASRMISGLSEEFNLENQSVGIYIVKSTLGSNEMTQKLIITK